VLLYLDQNAWVSLARGAWDKDAYPKEYAALSVVIDAIRMRELLVPLSFTNIYETYKINDPKRRIHMANLQATISCGKVFRSRRRIFTETVSTYLASRFELPNVAPEGHWFLSGLWFEATADYSPAVYGLEFSNPVLDYMISEPAKALFEFLASNDDDVRKEAVRRFSNSSAEHIAAIEARRAIVGGETLALRKRAYGARLLIDELEFVLSVGRELGKDWRMVSDIGSSLARQLIVDVPILHVERELVIRLEDHSRAITENDLRDMLAFIVVLPFADVVVAEKPFINLARQARLGEKFETKLLTSVFELSNYL
jgi:hypothetical protein